MTKNEKKCKLKAGKEYIMYCSKCGTKKNKGDKYCSNCGTKFTKLNKQTKKTITIVMSIIILTILIIGLFLHLNSPKTVALNYFKAIINQNTNQLYHYLNIEGDKTFINKTTIETLIKQVDIKEYNISNVTSKNNQANVTIHYQTNKDQTITIPLEKQTQFLFIKKWKISMNNHIIKDFSITVPKDSIITYAGVKVQKKYLERTTNNSDTYLLTQVLKAPTKIEITLPNGYQIEDEITPNTYKNKYTAQLSLDMIKKEEQTKIENTIQKDLTNLYENALKEKPLENKQLEKTYEQLIKNLKKAYNKLINIEFTKITLENVKLNEFGYLEFCFKANYKYQIKYTDFLNTEQTKESNSYTYMNATYQIDQNTYTMIDAKNLVDYFSRY